MSAHCDPTKDHIFDGEFEEEFTLDSINDLAELDETEEITLDWLWSSPEE